MSRLHHLLYSGPHPPYIGQCGAINGPHPPLDRFCELCPKGRSLGNKYSLPRDSRPTRKRRFQRPSPISDLSPTKTTRDPLGKVPYKRRERWERVGEGWERVGDGCERMGEGWERVGEGWERVGEGRERVGEGWEWLGEGWERVQQVRQCGKTSLIKCSQIECCRYCHTQFQQKDLGLTLVPKPKANTSRQGIISLTCFKSINQLLTTCQVCNEEEPQQNGFFWLRIENKSRSARWMRLVFVSSNIGHIRDWNYNIRDPLGEVHSKRPRALAPGQKMKRPRSTGTGGGGVYWSPTQSAHPSNQAWAPPVTAQTDR